MSTLLDKFLYASAGRRTFLASITALVAGRSSTLAAEPELHPRIAIQSVMSLLVQPRARGRALSNATGFVVNSKKGPVLLTNRHVVTLPDAEGHSVFDFRQKPTELMIMHNQKNKFGSWVEVVQPLYKDNRPAWTEHPQLGSQVDIIALPLDISADIDIYPYDLNVSDSLIVDPAENISVIGFPFGVSAGGFAIWATGFVASDLDIDFEGKSKFLIDCRARPGQSGSPVIAYRVPGWVRLTGVGGATTTPVPIFRFLGIYSGRINNESDLGIVWKKSLIADIINSI